MSKVILTVEQDKMIKEMLIHAGKDSLMNYHSGGFVDSNKQCLNDLAPSDMARVLYVAGGYEIEKPKLEVGDWVVHIKNGFRGVKQITFKNITLLKVKGDDVLYLMENTRHATKEEIFWAELGREVGEFRIGDVTLTNNGSEYHIDHEDTVLDEKDEYSKGKLKGFYPSESFKPFPTGDKS